MIQKKKKAPVKFWCFLLVVTLILGYLAGGLFADGIDPYGSLSMENYQDKFLYILQHPFENWMNEMTPKALLIALIIYFIALSYSLSNLKNYMPGKEMGGAQWGDIRAFNRKLQAPKSKLDTKEANMVLSQNLRKAYDTRFTLLNNNLVVIGGSGSGKTAGFIAPNLLQFHGSNVFTDPKGDTLKDFGEILKEEGYRLLVINLNEMGASHRYNPFRYIRSTEDLIKLISNLIANTSPVDAVKGDPFWEKAETLYLQAIFAYVWLECDDTPYHRFVQADFDVDAREVLSGCDFIQEVSDGIWSGIVLDETGSMMRMKKTFRTVLKLLDEAEVREEEGKLSPLDCRIKMLEKKLAEEHKDPFSHPAVRSYYKCIRGAGDTVRSIIISANSRFAPFDNENLLRILDEDDIDLPSLGVGVHGDERTKTALFCVLPDDDTTWNFVPGMLYTQMFQELYRVARQYGNRLPIDVGFWLDEFANIKMPNDFDKILATCRSRNIYIAIVLQSLAQIRALYKDKWEGLLGNCDSIVYLGGNEQSSHKYISEMLGKWTIDKKTSGQTLGSRGSSSRNFDILGRELLTPDEVRKMPNEDSIIFVRGEDPIYDKKLYWFKQKKWEGLKKFPSFQFGPAGEKEILFVNQQMLDYLKRDETKDISVCSMTLEEFLCLGLQEVPKEVSIEEVQKLLEVLTQKEEKTDRENPAIKRSEERSLKELVLESDLTPEQIQEISLAIADGIPEKVIRKMVLNRNTLEQIQMIRSLSVSGNIL